MEPGHVLSFATDKESQIHIHADREGLSQLIETLQSLRDNIDKNICEHDHLFSDDWGSGELTVTNLEPEWMAIHHVKIMA